MAIPPKTQIGEGIGHIDRITGPAVFEGQKSSCHRGWCRKYRRKKWL